MTAIHTKHLTKRFDEDIVAVDELDLRVEEGEVFGFLGPNGAGKSTVINMLLDFVRPTDGDVTVLGYDPTSDAEEIRRRTGVLPEGGSLYARLTGREHIEWIAQANETTVDADSLLGRVGLTSDEADRAVDGYSKGMRRRLALAMALVGDPELLILDEPSAGLDPTGMQEFREIIRAEAGNGRTVFFSSHILGEVEAVCDRIGILNDGRLVATGTPDALRSNLDLGGTISIDVAHVPDNLSLNAIDGVEDVTIEESTITATITDSTKKIEVISELDQHTRILDITSAETSLERLFNTYTSPSREEASAADTEISREQIGVKQ